MNDINNIDELLKNNIGHFEQMPPPDAWGAIQQGLTAAGTTPTGGAENVAAKAGTVIKSTGIITKIVLGVAISGVVAGGGYIAYTYNNKPTEVVSSTIQKPLEDQQPVQIIEESASEKAETADPVTTLKEDNTIAKTNKDNLSKESITATLPENNTSVVTGEVNKNEAPSQLQVNGNKDAVVNNADQKPVNNNQVKPVQPLPKPKPKHNFSNQGEQSNSPQQTSDNDAKPTIPNTFTPNNDGENDRFKVLMDNEVLYEMKIYDREGRLVFESNNKESMWDGTNANSGEACAPGMYQYIFIYQYANGKQHKVGGALVLLREKN